MQLTQNNVESTLGVSPECYPDVLPKVFELLIDPDLDHMALYHYVVAFRDALGLLPVERSLEYTGFDDFGKACLESGLIKAMMTITQDTRTDKWHGLSSYFAMDMFWHFARTGTTEERRALLQELLDHNALQICMAKLDHPLAIHRQAAVNTLHSWVSECFLGESLSSKQTSDILVKLCRLILAGPAVYSQQLGNPALTWQSLLCFGKFGHPREKARRYAPRYYGISQGTAAAAILNLLIRSPPPTQEFCYEILDQNPELLDMLFQCAAFPRPPWYPELPLDVISEALALLFRVPKLLIPGVETKSTEDIQSETVEEWKSLVKSVKLSATRPKGLVESILKVWETMELEKPKNIKNMMDNVSSRYFAMSTPDKECFLATFEQRGATRVCMERLIATITHCVDDTNSSDSDLLSLLRVSHQGCRPVKTAQQMVTLEDSYNRIESKVELFQEPLFPTSTEVKSEPSLQVASEYIMGPTAHARLLTVLAQREVLQKIGEMTKLPEGVSRLLTLPQLKQIASEDSIRQFLALARQRVTKRKEEGHKRYTQLGAMNACFIYATAAELAAAVIAFDDATQKIYTDAIPGVRRELVLCLGNAAEMAIGMKQFHKALCLANSAVDIASALPKDGPDAVDETIMDKNIKRVQRGLDGLKSLPPA